MKAVSRMLSGYAWHRRLQLNVPTAMPPLLNLSHYSASVLIRSQENTIQYTSSLAGPCILENIRRIQRIFHSTIQYKPTLSATLLQPENNEHMVTDWERYAVISEIFVFESRCFNCRYWTSWCISMLSVPNEGAKSMDRTESSDSLKSSDRTMI